MKDHSRVSYYQLHKDIDRVEYFSAKKYRNRMRHRKTPTTPRDRYKRRIQVLIFMNARLKEYRVIRAYLEANKDIIPAGTLMKHILHKINYKTNYKNNLAVSKS